MHTFRLGDFELTIISDGTYYLDAGAMFGVVPKTLWEKKYQADALNRMSCGTNGVLVRNLRSEQRVLIETGIGSKLPQKLDKIYDAKHLMLDNLRATGTAPEDIDIVINSHLHFDHCGWNTYRDAAGVVQPTFPRARYFAQLGEWEHAREQHDRDRVSYISDNYDPLIDSGQMTLIDGANHPVQEITDGIRVEVFPGHTRWMQAIFIGGDSAASDIRSRAQTACYISDLLPTSYHLDLTWVMSYDVFPLETIDNRKRYYAQSLNTVAEPNRFLTIFTHDHETPWAWLRADEKGRVIAETISQMPS